MEEQRLLPLHESTPVNSIIITTNSPEDVDDNSPLTAAVVFSSSVALCRYFIVGGCCGYSSPAESGIMEDLGLSVAAYSVFGSALTVGALLGSLVNGKIADISGRKFAMWLADLFYIIGWVIIVFSKEAWLLDLGRVSHGIGNGISAYVVPIYVSEIAPKNIRGALTSAIMMLFTFGFSFAYCVGIVVSWRILALIFLVPCLVQVSGTFFIPESPRWLAKIGRTREVDTNLQHLRGKSVDISHELANIKDYAQACQELAEDKCIELFQYKYAYSLVVGVTLMGLSQLGGITAVGFYASSIFEKAGFSSSVGTVSMAVIQIPSSVLSVFLVDKYGRRPLLLISSAGMCLFSFLVGLSFCFQDSWGYIASVMAFIGILGFSVSYGSGMSCIPSVMMSEVFPMNIKSSAGSLSTFISNLCSWTASYSFNFLMDWSSLGTFFILSGISGFSVTFVAMLVPETKGRTLEEIQSSMIDHPLQ